MYYVSADELAGESYSGVPVSKNMPWRAALPNVLVLEDEPLIATMLDELIGSWGFVAHIGHNLTDARVALSVLTFDAALLDFSLPNSERGSEIADVLIERGTPLAFVTGYDQVALEPRHQRLPLLRKPFTEHQLCTLMSLLLGSGERSTQRQTRPTG